ncbi:hypothetical protein [Agrobacterium sp. CFBP2214]|uniref:hypothetical protein n=1 Tax=Agrobacterium sp. CFBP2214 TaxID=3040274 RepID=UPI00254E2BF0|nr:hypothetical protein [Agrobacterium sp. CFBP2214]
MTIKERQLREAHDRENPWRPMSEAMPDGTICDLLFDDMMGHYGAEDRQFFLDASGIWFCIDPPERSRGKPINWRPAFVRLTPERRQLIKRRASER